MRFIKRHRHTIVLVILFILIVILGFKVKEMLVPDEGKASYGERLKDIDKHPIDKEVYNKVDEEFANNDKIIKITHRLQGKVLNYFITFADKVSQKDARSIGEKLVTLFDEEILEYYSIQIYLVKENKKENDFPIIGMKDPLSKTVSWTRERQKVDVSDTDEE